MKAIVTGASGMDGSYLVEDLLSFGYEVWGIVRRNSTNNLGNLQEWVLGNRNFKLTEGDITDFSFLSDLFSAVQPDQIYNMAAQSHVGTSFELPNYTLDVTGLGAINVMQAMKTECPNAKLLQASSSEMFGNAKESEFPLNENTPLRPISPYAVAKTAAHHMAGIMRKRGLWVSTSICFNHESLRRGEKFLTAKATKAAAKKEKVRLGNLDAIRDWGYAPEYVKGMQMILDHSEPDDFVLATGEGHSVREFVELAYDLMGLNPEEYVEFNVPEFVRPVELNKLIGNPMKAKRLIKWIPEIEFESLVEIMLDTAVMGW
jgi:GDPmannose 4,6-dehydratase